MDSKNALAGWQTEAPSAPADVERMKRQLLELNQKLTQTQSRIASQEGSVWSLEGLVAGNWAEVAALGTDIHRNHSEQTNAIKELTQVMSAHGFSLPQFKTP